MFVLRDLPCERANQPCLAAQNISDTKSSERQGAGRDSSMRNVWLDGKHLKWRICTLIPIEGTEDY